MKGLRVGRSVIDAQEERSKSATAYRFRLREGPPVTLHFAPELPAGMTIVSAERDGKRVNVGAGRTRGRLSEPITFVLTKSSVVSFAHTGGVGLVPLTPKPAPEDSSTGYRIISGKLEGNRYTAEVEGRSGTSHVFDVVVFDQRVTAIQGGIIDEISADGTVRVRVTFDRTGPRYSKQQFTVTLNGLND